MVIIAIAEMIIRQKWSRVPWGFGDAAPKEVFWQPRSFAFRKRRETPLLGLIILRISLTFRFYKKCFMDQGHLFTLVKPSSYEQLKRPKTLNVNGNSTILRHRRLIR